MRFLAAACVPLALTLTAIACGGSAPPASSASSKGNASPAASSGSQSALDSIPNPTGWRDTQKPAQPAGRTTATLAGIVFVDSSVTGMGSKAPLPAGTKIYPPGSRITGTTGCSTNRYGTDGQMLLVIDYKGRSTAANVMVRRTNPALNYVAPPYYIDLDSGRTVQFLGPEHGNGTYHVTFTYHLEQGRQGTLSADFTLDRTCPAVR